MDVSIPRSLETAAIRRWLGRGWQDFSRTVFASTIFSLAVTLVAVGSILALSKAGLILVLYPLLTGFMLIAPILVVGYYQVAVLLEQGRQPSVRDLFYGFAHAGRDLWVIALLLGFFFLIWVTDALLIYVMYFGVDSKIEAMDALSDPAVVDNVTYYILFASIVGCALAFAIYTVSVFSIPLVFHRRCSFVPAIVTSVKTVFAHFQVMVFWAVLLAGVTLFSLLVFLPLLVVVLPVFAYATHAAYREAFGGVSRT